jgi:uncharacterized HAD superfamily protein
MSEAKAFPAVKEFIASAITKGHEVFVVSHKTLYTIAGVKHDLHRVARDWLEMNEFSKLGLTADKVYFELTREEKIARIRSLSCDVFVDDLPEVLEALGPNTDIRRILFDPYDIHRRETRFDRMHAWGEGVEFILHGDGR